jgi:hypothetical protein
MIRRNSTPVRVRTLPWTTTCIPVAQVEHPARAASARASTAMLKAEILLLAALRLPSIAELPCVFNMLGWIEDIDWNSTNPSPLRNRVCNACFRWASRPRTQQEGLLFVTRRCECDVIEADHTKMWHDRGIRMFQAAARKAEEKGLSYRLEAHWHFLSTLLQVLGDLTTDQHTYKQINRVYRLLRRRSWPNIVAHLLPTETRTPCVDCCPGSLFVPMLKWLIKST